MKSSSDWLPRETLGKMAIEESGTISVEELAEWRRAGKPLTLLDVRDPEEYACCHLEGSLLIPLAEIPIRLAELPRELPIVCLCHHGIRSAVAMRYLLANGFEQVWNLTGGIDAWSRRVDPGIPVY